MHADLVIHNIATLYTGNQSHKRGKEMNEIITKQNAFIAIKDGIIVGVGEGDYTDFVSSKTELFNAHPFIAIPGLIDSHTHLVHGGSREHEFSKKIAGVPYLDILNEGGGILSTVQMTRDISFDNLYRKSLNSVYEMMSFGVTTIEAKSGYGLNKDNEIKQLLVAKKLNEETPADIISTYLGAHAYPIEFKHKKLEYIESIMKDMIEIKKLGLAEFIDVFCEDSVFNYKQSKEILAFGKELGFKIKIHADEIVSLGGAELAVSLGASSADHLMAISDADIAVLGASNTVANLLPSTSFYLNKDYAPARKLIEANCIVSLSSDFNPGSSPSENFQLMTQIAANKLRMTPNEILNATTINAAYNLGISDKVGSIELGKKADIVLMDSPNLEYLYYHFGVNHTKHVFKDGTLIYKNRNFI